MSLFPEDLLTDLRQIPGADHSFLKQLADDDGRGTRQWLDGAVDRVGGAVADRWAQVLGSLDNRRFFQGYAEISTSDLLSTCGWRINDLAWPGPSLAVRDPSGQSFNAIILGFIKQIRPIDQDAIGRLVRSLGRVGSRSRIVVLVRRWLPHDFDPEPVRRAIDLWLREVDRAGWEGRYAEYRDANVSLEFALTGEQAHDGQQVVAMAMGPYDAHRTMDAVEQRVVYELDAYRLSAWSEQPVLLSLVCDQLWSLPRGYVRELLYGKPVSQETLADTPHFRATFGVEMTPSLFRDPLYRTVSAAVLVQREPGATHPTAFASYVNPWAQHPIDPQSLPGRVFAIHDRDGDAPVMAWRDT
ncbi:MAG: hypothetical protein GXP62_22145 [Oligoflexia bacterium]|nr:hypothetical protein [Oligoflexia bacterium]